MQHIKHEPCTQLFAHGHTVKTQLPCLFVMEIVPIMVITIDRRLGEETMIAYKSHCLDDGTIGIWPNLVCQLPIYA